MTPTWSVDTIPDLTGRRALVTGASGGLGLHTVTELARKGAEVVATARTEEKLDEVVAAVRRAVPTSRLTPLVLDLADLASVRRAAADAGSAGPVHLLVNNAGVMATPRLRTADGFELQLGTNHLGHFALTGLLWPQLVAAGGARVVTVSSLMHRVARAVDLSDPRDDTRPYQKWLAYGQSKLANLLFAFELDRRARAAGAAVTSVAAHPGYAATSLQSTGLGGRGAEQAILLGVTRLVGQPAGHGALPLLMAATLPGLPGGSYVGPGGLGELRGAPKLVGTSRAAKDQHAAERLWELSESATGVRFP